MIFHSVFKSILLLYFLISLFIYLVFTPYPRMSHYCDGCHHYQENGAEVRSPLKYSVNDTRHDAERQTFGVWYQSSYLNFNCRRILHLWHWRPANKKREVTRLANDSSQSDFNKRFMPMGMYPKYVTTWGWVKRHDCSVMNDFGWGFHHCIYLMTSSSLAPVFHRIMIPVSGFKVPLAEQWITFSWRTYEQ